MSDETMTRNEFRTIHELITCVYETLKSNMDVIQREKIADILLRDLSKQVEFSEEIIANIVMHHEIPSDDKDDMIKNEDLQDGLRRAYDDLSPDDDDIPF